MSHSPIVVPAGPRFGRTSLVLFLLVAIAFPLAGCAVGPKYKTPTATAQMPPAYREIGNWKTAQPNDQNLGGNWWELFQDSQLNALERQIEVSNENLKAATAQINKPAPCSATTARIIIPPSVPILRPFAKGIPTIALRTPRHSTALPSTISLFRSTCPTKRTPAA